MLKSGKNFAYLAFLSLFLTEKLSEKTEILTPINNSCKTQNPARFITNKKTIDLSCNNNNNINMMKNNLKQHIGYWINRIRTQTNLSFEDRLKQYKITVPQWCVLVTIYNEQGTNIKEISTYIEIDKGAISRVVDALVAKGLVIHGPGKDGRSGHISLTPEGEMLVPLLLQEAEQNELQFFGTLTTSELDQLQHILRKIIHSSIPSIKLEGWLEPATLIESTTPKKEIEND